MSIINLGAEVVVQSYVEHNHKDQPKVGLSDEAKKSLMAKGLSARPHSSEIEV